MPLTATPQAREADRGVFRDRAAPASADRSSPLRPVDLELVTTRADFDALEDEWNALFERAGPGHADVPDLQLALALVQSLRRTEARARASPIVTARRDGGLVLVWPLVPERAGVVHAAYRGWASLSANTATSSWTMRPTTSISCASLELSSSTQTQAGVVQLRKVRADAAVAPLMRELALIETSSSTAPYLDLANAPSFASTRQRYSSSARKNRRRQRRRLEDHGPMRRRLPSGGAAARDLARRGHRAQAQRGSASAASSRRRLPTSVRRASLPRSPKPVSGRPAAMCWR